MSKTRKFGRSLTTKDWMKYRPYNNFSGYDGYYLKLAKTVFEYLNHPQWGFKETLSREDLREVAVLLTCHFEDFINGIGLWQAFLRKNEELYGRQLPLYNLEDYDPDYLNPQDFAYLLWHHMGKLARKTLDPYSMRLLDAAAYCYEFFEKRIDQAPVTNFYDQWLDISANTYFFELKKRLIWMASENYLIAPELNVALKESIEDFFEESTESMRMMDPGKVIYGIREDYLLKTSSSWCALTAPEWLAEVARCTDEVRDNIRRLFQRVQGMFLYQGHDERYYHFEFLASGRKFFGSS